MDHMNHIDQMEEKTTGSEKLHTLQEKKTLQQVRISVRNLVEFLMRSGDIDNRVSRGMQLNAMQEGTRIHKKLQRAMGSSYQAEVPLRLEVETERYVLIIEGRADGIYERDGITCIDEIKGVYRDVEEMEAPVAVHLAQAKCYAYIYALQQGLDPVGVQMTYCDLDTEQVSRFYENYAFAELKTGAAGIGGRCVPHDPETQKSVYSGADRNRQDGVGSVSGGARGRRRLWGEDLLPDRKDSDGDGGDGYIRTVSGAWLSWKGRADHSKRKTVQM